MKSNREHSFDWELAVIVGVEKAILLKNISYWCEENRRRGIEAFYVNGRYWVRESLNSLSFKYPYLKRSSINRWLNELCISGWVSMFSQSGGTNLYSTGAVFDAWNYGEDWKALIDSRLEPSQNETPEHLLKMRPPLSQNETPEHLLKMRHPLSQNETPRYLKMRHRVSQNETHVYSDVSPYNVDSVGPAQLKKDSSKIRGTSKPSGGRAPRLFSESEWAGASPQQWATALATALATASGMNDIDSAWYFLRVRDWSATKGATSCDWVATAAQFAKDDQRKSKLVTVKPATNADPTAILTNPLTGNTTTADRAARAAASAARVAARWANSGV